MTMDHHPIASIFPLMEGREFDNLVASIKANGLREPVILYEGKVLDGRNRARACKAAGVKLMTLVFSGDDPVKFVIDKNIHRRHLTESQRAMIAASLATLKKGHVASQRIEKAQEKDGDQIKSPQLSADQAGKLMKVSRAAIASAKLVKKEGTTEEIASIERGTATIGGIASRIRTRQKQKKSNGKDVSKKQVVQGTIWRQFRDALVALTGLPSPSDVVLIAAARKNITTIVDERLPNAAAWLKEFHYAWDHRND